MAFICFSPPGKMENMSSSDKFHLKPTREQNAALHARRDWASPAAQAAQAAPPPALRPSRSKRLAKAWEG